MDNFIEPFDVPPKKATLNYNFLETITGIGYAVLYAGIDSSDNNFLISSAIKSDSSYRIKKVSTTSSSYVEVINEDFSSIFKSNQIIEGRMFVSFTNGFYATAGSGFYLKGTLTIKKNSTTLATATLPTFEDTSATTTTSKEETISLDITKTSFNIGDSFTVNISIVAKIEGGGTLWVGLGVDPLNREDDFSGFKTIEEGDSTQFLAYIPFKIL